MAGVLLNTRIPKQLHDDIMLFARAAGYGGVQEFTREALRDHLQRRRIEWGREEMARLYGSQKHKAKAVAKKEQQFKREKAKELFEARKLRELYGVAKHMKIKELTRKERDAIAKEYVKKVFVKK